MKQQIPAHLKKYIVPQNYGKYTTEDQEVWRLLLKKIVSVQKRLGCPGFAEGLQKTGVSFDRIPEIKEMDRRLQDFGQRAVPISGFLPPKVFMDFQSHGILPVASDIRKREHISYTPAPDIVHEAVGHAPFLIHPAFSAFLKEYARTVQKAVVSFQDRKIYKAIRLLSDLKESRSASKQEIRQAETRLSRIKKSMKKPSEASRLSRFIWWTSEYGLKGPLKNPKIYGAGLVSSFEEAERSVRVKKIPLSKDCLNYSYDITTFQPQLFVAPDFERLREVLHEISQNMAFRKGGPDGLKEALESETFNTAELDTGLQISGVLSGFETDSEGRPSFLKFKGPAQLSFKGKELPGQGRARHKDGFSSPLGLAVERKDIKPGRETDWIFPSGVRLKGRAESATLKEGRVVLVTFQTACVQKGRKILYKPEWGPFDLAVGSSVVSVFSGPADEKAFFSQEEEREKPP